MATSKPLSVFWFINLVMLINIALEADARSFFVFADSLVDNGINNFLPTTACTEKTPYGIDYPTKRPTWLFSDGLHNTDFISHPCCENPPTLAQATAEEGRIEEIGGLKSYTAGSPSSKLAVILLSDIFGYEAPKLRRIADKVAAAGFYAVVPDFFRGDPYLPEKSYSTWSSEHQPVEGCEDARKVVADLKSKGASAVGAAGFCWGGMVVSKLSTYGENEAAVILHPGPLEDDDLNATKVPTAILGGEFDEYFPPEAAKRAEEILSAISVDNFVKIYPGVGHGWAVRYEDDDEQEVKMAMEAQADMLKWLIKYLK